jgi:hypothetical protein
MRYLVKLLLLILMSLIVQAAPGCVGKMTNPITDVCWKCLFPIRVAGFKLANSSMPDSDNGQHFIEERASNLATNYRGSELESIALNNAYSETASSMEALSRRQGQLSSLESSQLKDYSQRWLSGKDASSGTNQSVVEAANRLASTGTTSSENHSARDSKGTDTHASLNAGGSLFGVGGSAGVSAKNSSDASHDKSVGSNMSYQEAENIMRNYAKNHDLRDSSGKSESVSENLQKTWRDQEQVAVDKSNTQQRMNSLQQQISYTSQNVASIDSNYNDKVLDETAARYGLSNKEEALAHLNANPNEGKQVLQELVAQKYGSSMSSQVANKGGSLANQVDHSLNTNLDTHHKEAKENLKIRYNNISSDENDEMNSKASEVKRAVDNNINTTGETINNGKLDLDSKINSTQEKIKQDQQGAQQHFNDISDSTLQRAGGKALENTSNAFKEGFKSTGLEQGAETWEELEEGAKRLQYKPADKK